MMIRFQTPCAVCADPVLSILKMLGCAAVNVTVCGPEIAPPLLTKTS